MARFKRVARSLTVLKKEVDLSYPGRPIDSDGALGDTAHANRVSDHNPNALGIVCALDLTEWIEVGIEMNDVLAEFLRTSLDPRIKYVISDGRMFSSYDSVKDGKVVRRAWKWGPYDGPNKHTKHVHISVWKNYDDTKPWGFKVLGRNSHGAAIVVPVVPLTKKDELMEILNPHDDDDMYLHIIGKGLVHMTDIAILKQYQKVYPEIQCSMAWVSALTARYA